jgi:hypothetical protein
MRSIQGAAGAMASRAALGGSAGRDPGPDGEAKLDGRLMVPDLAGTVPPRRAEASDQARGSRDAGTPVTPPDTMNAITSALAASSGSSIEDGKTTRFPAKLYDCGKYTEE